MNAQGTKGRDKGLEALVAGAAVGGVAAIAATGAGLIGGALLRRTPLAPLVPPAPLMLPLGLVGGTVVGAAAGIAAASAVGSGSKDSTPRG